MALSPLVKFGTSTWTYEGWYGIIYQKLYPPGRFKLDCLAEYARYEYRGEPLFRTVGFDQTFYQPPMTAQLEHYARQVPPGFEVCSKVWEEITIPTFAPHPRYGARAGLSNPRFLDAEHFIEYVIAPYSQAFQAYTGPFIFEFQRWGSDPETFLQKLDRFLSRLPREYRYAVEVRNAAFLGPDYHAILRAHGVAHVYNHWTHMPPLAQQHEALKSFTAPFVLARLLTPLGVRYEQAVKLAEPYNRLVRPLAEMRDDVIHLITLAVAEGRPIYVLVNNRAEGCAPLTIQALADQLQATH